MRTDAERKIIRAFKAQKASAAGRGIAFSLTFEDWWALWAPHWHRRGTGRDDMQMCRTRDEGGYELGNVRIATQRENAAEHGVMMRVKRAPMAFRRGVTKEVSVGAAADWAWRGFVFHEYRDENETVDS